MDKGCLGLGASDKIKRIAGLVISISVK